MTKPQETPLAQAVRIAGGPTSMAKALGLSGHAVIYQWQQTRVPAEHCPNVEALTGITCEALRPDVNWSVLRGRPVKPRKSKAVD